MLDVEGAGKTGLRPLSVPQNPFPAGLPAAIPSGLPGEEIKKTAK